MSPRQSKPFIQVNCGAVPEALVECELFGHEKGAFTGAVERKIGRIEMADKGTLFLDEIGDTSAAVQVKLLRLLEERTFERVGGTQVLDAGVRVVAATNRDLHQMIEAGTFREDLYFRLQGFEVQLPPLRKRQEDIPLLALHFISRPATHLHKKVEGLSAAAEEALVGRAWPGNVRELRYVIERAVIVCHGPTIQVGDLALMKTKGTDAKSMFIDDVKKAMQYGREEARRLGNHYISTEHLLLGLIKMDKGRGVLVLTVLGIDVDRLKQAVEDYVTTSARGQAIDNVPITPRAKQLLELAAKEAPLLGDTFVGLEHMLLGLLKDKEGVAAQVLVAFGVDYQRVMDALKGGRLL